jgi:FkbM family methyltransferase
MRALKNLIRLAFGFRNDTDYFAQCGEDAVVSSIFRHVFETNVGFYFDIGAYHPYRHSNTYLLYRAGWQGINVDPRPGTKDLFDRYRPRDINVEAGIASADGAMTYYMVGEDSTMNTFSRENLETLGIFDRVLRTIEVPVWSLPSLLSRYPDITKIDYMNVDAEGFEMEILEGLDRSKLKPTIISIEQNGIFSLADVLTSETCSRMARIGYAPIAKNVILRNVATVFYTRSDLL